MKTILTVIAVIMTSLPLITGCSTAQAAPQDMATATQKIVNQVKEQDNSVFEEIQKNIDMVSNLKSDIETSKEFNKQKLLNNVVKELEKVADSYDALSGKRDEIRKSLLKKITAIEELQKQVQQKQRD
jgi:predicted small secreted protein